MKKLLALSLVLLLGVTCMAKWNYFDDIYIGGDVTVIGTVTFADLDIVGDLDVNGALISLDGSTSVISLSAGYVATQSDDIRLGLDADDYMLLVTTNSSANLAITHPGNTPAITWTATSFNFTGTFEVDGFTASGASALNGGITVDTTNFSVDGSSGTIVTAADIDVQGSDITNTTVGAGLHLEATAAAANTATSFVEISGTTAAHATLTGTDIFLDINPIIGIPTGTAADVHLIDLTFSSPAWSTAVTSNVRGIYFAPTIGNATTGTNTVALIDIAAIAGDAQVSLYGIRFGDLTGTGATEQAISIGQNWDYGIDSASSITISDDSQLDLLIYNETTGSDQNSGYLTLRGYDHDTTTPFDMALMTTVTTSTDYRLSFLPTGHGTEVASIDQGGDLQIDGDFTVDGGGIIDTTAAGTLLLDAADQTADTAKIYVSITGSTPAHNAGATTTDIFLDVSPTIGIATGTAVAQTHLIDLTFTTPAWVTAGATGTVRGIYLAPTLGAATTGTNTLALIDIAAITGDDDVDTYGIRMGAMTGGTGTDNAIDIAAGWDAGFDSASPVVLTTAAGDIDVQGEDITNSIAGGGLDFAATQAAAGTATTFYDFVATINAHTSNTPDDVILELSPTLGLPTVVTTARFVNSVFTLPSYATAVASDVDMWFIDPTIGDPSAGTNSFTIIEVAAIGDLDAEQDFYGIRFGDMTQEGGSQTAQAFIVGTGFDAGLDTESPIVLENDEILNNAGDGVVTVTGDDDTGLDLQIISADHNTTGDASLTLDADAGGDDDDTWILRSTANGNAFDIIQHATTEFSISSAGDVTVTGDITVTGGNVIDGSGGGVAVADKGTSVETLGGVQKSIITLTLTGGHDLDLIDGNHGAGIKVYDFPEGRIYVLGVVIDASVAHNGAFNGTPNDVFVVSCGTEVAADEETLTGTEADIIPSTELDTESGATSPLDWHAELAASAFFDGTGGAIDLYVNVACADGSNSGATTYAVTGTVTIHWINLGDY